MNEEMQTILMNLPEGIILVNKQTQEVALGNMEFRRLFGVERQATHKEIAERLKDPILSVFNSG